MLPFHIDTSLEPRSRELPARVSARDRHAGIPEDLFRAADLRPGEQVLDVACGTGVISRLAAERVGLGGSVTAIDIAPDMIDVAKAVAGPDGAKIDWRTADAQPPPLPDASVDVVLCQMGLSVFTGELLRRYR